MEPYAASDKEIAFLVTFCAENNLRFAITGHSAHYPGATFRVVIWRPQDEKKSAVCVVTFRNNVECSEF